MILKHKGCLFALVPFAVLCVATLTNAVDVPYLDQWESFLPVLERHYTSQLKIGDLWEQGNGEARVFFPRVVMIALASLTGWNILAEIIVNLLLALACLFLLWRQLQRDNVCAGNMDAILINGFAILLFSLSQWENWTWGWQMIVFVNLLASLVCFDFLSRPATHSNVLIAAVAGMVATGSFSAGLSLWIVGGVLLAISLRDAPGARAALVLWLAVSIAVVYAYFFGYHSVSKHPSLFEAVHRPLDFIRYVLMFLGSPVAFMHPRLALLAGIAGLGLFLWFVRRALAVRPVSSASRFFLAIGLYAILNALVAGIARMGFGVEQSCSSRYITFGQLLWIANLYFIARALQATVPGETRWISLQALGATIILAILPGWYQGSVLMRHRAEVLRSAARELRTGNLTGPSSSQVFVPTTVSTARRWVDTLRRHHLSLLRDDPE